MRRKTKAADKVSALMKKKIDARELAFVENPNLHEKLVLQLSTEIHDSRSDGAAVSWAAQEEAAAYFNEHGFVDTLDYMLKLRAKNEKTRR